MLNLSPKINVGLRDIHDYINNISVIWITGFVWAVQVFLEPVFPGDGFVPVYTRDQDRIPVHLLGTPGEYTYMYNMYTLCTTYILTQHTVAFHKHKSMQHSHIEFNSQHLSQSIPEIRLGCLYTYWGPLVCCVTTVQHIIWHNIHKV